MRRFGIEGLLEVLLQFAIVLVPLLLALIGPLIAKLVKKKGEAAPPPPVAPVARREPRAQEEAGRRADADLAGRMRHVEQAARAEPTGRQVQDERTVIQEIRR